MTDSIVMERGPTGHRKGECHGMARYLNDTVEQARQLRDEGWKQEAIAKQLGVPRRTLSDWLAYKTR
jgi:hypothetical protein